MTRAGRQHGGHRRAAVFLADPDDREHGRDILRRRPHRIQAEASTKMVICRMPSRGYVFGEPVRRNV